MKFISGMSPTLSNSQNFSPAELSVDLNRDKLQFPNNLLKIEGLGYYNAHSAAQ